MHTKTIVTPQRKVKKKKKRKSRIDEPCVSRYGAFLNDHQMFLYRRLIFGIVSYKQEDIKKLKPGQKFRIYKNHQRTKELLCKLKQSFIMDITNKVFIKYFPESPMTKSLIGMTKYFLDEKPVLTFKQLGITRELVINHLIAHKLLPKEFWTITEAPVKKPRLPRLKQKSDVNLKVDKI
jgi:hypothetical protein